jgi:hypothetical protein
MFKKIISTVLLITMLLPVGNFIQPMQTTFAQADNQKEESKNLNTFDVSEYLKIEEGQTYLETTTGEGKEEKVNLQSGVIYFAIKFIELLTKIIGSFALLFLITGGLILMVSHGNSQLQTKGKQMILYSLLGVIVIFGSLIIVTFVQSLFFTT